MMQARELKKIQQELSLSNAQLALILGVSHATVLNWRKNKSRIPGPVAFIFVALVRVPEVRALLSSY